jgi:hypothetical protein
VAVSIREPSQASAMDIAGSTVEQALKKANGQAIDL